MSKVATYLQGHIAGEVTTRTEARILMSRDTGVFKIEPEMIVSPRATNDIRKLTRFAWQLAEKGHVLPITARGAGCSPAGGALGKGAIVDLKTHMDAIFEYEPKHKLVRAQAGASLKALSSALWLHGVGIMAVAEPTDDGTIGGAVAANVRGPMSPKYNPLAESIQQLEVVLSSGDVLQTGRINKRELSKLKGMQGFVGDIYRGIDNVIEDNRELINNLDQHDESGYAAVRYVKRKDGSFDLTPLLAGSEGTLGIISEMILKAEFRSQHRAVAMLVFANAEAARDSLDVLTKLSPAFMDYFDAELFTTAAQYGKTYPLYQSAVDAFVDPAGVVLVGFDDFSDGRRKKSLKKIAKLFKGDNVLYHTAEGESAADLWAVRDVLRFTQMPEKKDESSPPLFDGFYIPPNRLEEFVIALTELSDKLHIKLPISGRVLDGIYGVHPTLQMSNVGDKQKVFKLLDELSKLVSTYGGLLISEGAEGRLKTRFAESGLDEAVVKMYADIKNVFDPYGILNPGVKQVAELRTLASMLSD